MCVCLCVSIYIYIYIIELLQVCFTCNILLVIVITFVFPEFKGDKFFLKFPFVANRPQNMEKICTELMYVKNSKKSSNLAHSDLI